MAGETRRKRPPRAREVRRRGEAPASAEPAGPEAAPRRSARRARPVEGTRAAAAATSPRRSARTARTAAGRARRASRSRRRLAARALGQRRGGPIRARCATGSRSLLPQLALVVLGQPQRARLVEQAARAPRAQLLEQRDGVAEAGVERDGTSRGAALRAVGGVARELQPTLGAVASPHRAARLLDHRAGLAGCPRLAVGTSRHHRPRAVPTTRVCHARQAPEGRRSYLQGDVRPMPTCRRSRPDRRRPRFRAAYAARGNVRRRNARGGPRWRQRSSTSKR